MAEKKNKRYDYYKMREKFYKRFSLKINVKENDVIEKLESQASINSYILELIKKDIGK